MDNPFWSLYFDIFFLHFHLHRSWHMDDFFVRNLHFIWNLHLNDTFRPRDFNYFFLDLDWPWHFNMDHSLGPWDLYDLLLVLDGTRYFDVHDSFRSWDFH